MKLKLTTWILIGMAAGIAVGHACHTQFVDAQEAKAVAGYFSVFTDLFLRLIKMIVAPLVLSTLVVGVAKMGDLGTIGRLGAKTLGWFFGASFVSLALGALLANWWQPGVGLNFPLPDASASSGLKTSSLSIKEFVAHLVPRSVFEALATNEILQIVVFAGFFSVAIAAIGKPAEGVVHLLDQVAHIMLKVTGYVMKLAPLAVFAAMASIITTQGLGVLKTYGTFMGEFYLGLLTLWVVLVGVALLVLGPRVFNLVKLLRAPMLLAFSTASSEAAYPKTLEQLERFGVPNKIGSFVLPMGYSFNLDGSMMYCTFASLFIAQAYGVHLSVGQQLTMLTILMLTSKGMAGVPRASLVVIAATLSQFNIPEAGLLLIMGVDQFLDMGRSVTNVLGNGLATSVLAKWEGELGQERSEDVPADALLDAEPVDGPARQVA
jgi:Na+/H+-dicarboxylate symporter